MSQPKERPASGGRYYRTADGKLVSQDEQPKAEPKPKAKAGRVKKGAEK